jgi:hypothetical protein
MTWTLSWMASWPPASTLVWLETRAPKTRRSEELRVESEE